MEEILASIRRIISEDAEPGKAPAAAATSHEGEVLELLAAAHAAGATLVLVTHSAEVAGHGTRVVHVRDGLIESDSPVRRRG